MLLNYNGDLSNEYSKSGLIWNLDFLCPNANGRITWILFQLSSGMDKMAPILAERLNFILFSNSKYKMAAILFHTFEYWHFEFGFQLVWPFEFPNIHQSDYFRPFQKYGLARYSDCHCASCFVKLLYFTLCPSFKLICASQVCLIICF